MTCYLITETELEILHEKPWSAQLIYLRAIRPYMDYATGIVGLRRGISRQSIAEELTVPGGQGRHHAKRVLPSAKVIRHGLEVLKDCGLIEMIPADKKLVFRLPYANQDTSVQNMRGRSGAEKRGRMRDRVGATDDGAFDEMRSRMRGRVDTHMRGIHPVSGNNLEKEEYNLSTAPSGTEMSDDQENPSPGLSMEDGKEKSRSHQPMESVNPEPVTSPDPWPRDMPARQAPLLPVMEVSPTPAAAPSAPPSLPATLGEKAIPSRKAAKTPLPTEPVWQAYTAAFRERYQVDPPRNATVNTQMANFVKRVGAQDAPKIAAHYLGLSDRMYMQDYHSVGLMLKQAEKLKTQWAISNRTAETPTAAQVFPRSNVIAL